MILDAGRGLGSSSLLKYIYDAFKRSAIPLADRMGTTSLKKYSTTK